MLITKITIITLKRYPPLPEPPITYRLSFSSFTKEGLILDSKTPDSVWYSAITEEYLSLSSSAGENISNPSPFTNRFLKKLLKVDRTVYLI